MTTETMNLLAVLFSPVIAVVITLWYQNRKEKRDAKLRLFITLMAQRKSMPPAYDLVNALNLIDVVFQDHDKVLQLWHEYYDLLCAKPLNLELVDHKYIDMLSEIARVLHYKKLKQTDIDKFYSPVAHGNQAELNYKTQTELLRVLQNTTALVVHPKEDK